ncbi:metallo-peptidase family m12B reprolysin-like domain-containing protein [Ditylenchus destructor]|nr:metallo-peptidase family m12B reprolysin-like domain-containing protein [Ditylenchus destructor]
MLSTASSRSVDQIFCTVPYYTATLFYSMHYLTYVFDLSQQVLLFSVLIFIIEAMRGEAGPKHLPKTARTPVVIASPVRSKVSQSASAYPAQDDKENQPPRTKQQFYMPKPIAPRTDLRPRSPVKDEQVLQKDIPRQRDRHSPRQSSAQQGKSPHHNLHVPQPRDIERKIRLKESPPPPQFETRVCKVKVYFDDSFVIHAANDNWDHNPTTHLDRPAVAIEVVDKLFEKVNESVFNLPANKMRDGFFGRINFKTAERPIYIEQLRNDKDVLDLVDMGPVITKCKADFEHRPVCLNLFLTDRKMTDMDINARGLANFRGICDNAFSKSERFKNKEVLHNLVYLATYKKNLNYEDSSNDIKWLAYVLAHEFAHGMGALHDNSKAEQRQAMQLPLDCPVTQEAHIMFPYDNETGKSKGLFSPCSLRDMGNHVWKVLNKQYHDSIKNCLTKH